MLRIGHVDESIANVTFILKSRRYISFSNMNRQAQYDRIRSKVAYELDSKYLKINRQVNKIVSSLMTFINSSQEHL
jgi:hypothetical protein